ncbi:MAG TPA: lytic transglycosylase domain-containing protein [Atribacteraceae bacterium]|nr:lytic transglycosylase domain-containing protein [Atribacteraceae bacterium]
MRTYPENLHRVMSRISEIASRFHPPWGFSPTTNPVGQSGREFHEPEIKRIPNASSPEEFDHLVEKYARKYGFEKEFINRVIAAESGFNPDVVSPKGAMGLMQLMPGTARMLGVDDPFDVRQNLEGGMRYLRGLVNRFGDIRLALAAYNAGSGRVVEYGGVPPFEETQNYVRKILGE